MRHLALSTLFHERGKLVAAIVGVAFATTLVLVQTGLYYGFRQSAGNLIAYVGGDLWVMAKGTRLLDYADTLSAGARQKTLGHPCVASVRGLVMDWATLRKPGGGVEKAQLVGFDPEDAGHIPWSLHRGLASDLHAPMRVAVEKNDLGRLQLPEEALGASLEINDRTVYVAALTSGVRSFTISPYVFAEAKNAQRLMRFGEEQYTFLVVRVRDATCASDVARFVDATPDLAARTPDEFRAMTADYWMEQSGAGASLAFSAMLGFLVGGVVVGQMLYSITESRLRELATLRTMGATKRELAAYVGWQAAFLGVVGGLLGLLFALAIQRGARGSGLVVVLSPGVLLLGLSSIAVMCGAAGLVSARKVLGADLAAVFR